LILEKHSIRLAFGESYSVYVKKLVHPALIEIIEKLFLISSAQIKWNDCLSSSVPILSGVRQGGILSPLLFSIYIDSVLDILDSSNLGCFINNRCVNSFLYADDLILISPSVHGLQALLSLASVSFLNLGFEINPSKSCCLRIGHRFMSSCQDICVNGTPIHWVKEARYLGVVFKSSKHLSFNWFEARGNYYRALNSILGSLGRNPPLDVIFKLVKTICFPILSYGIAAVSLSSVTLTALHMLTIIYLVNYLNLLMLALFLFVNIIVIFYHFMYSMITCDLVF